MDTLLGIDFGTGGCKITVTDIAGHVITSASAEYPTEHKHPGWSEQQPEDWWKAMCQVLTQLKAAPELAGTTPVAVALDSYTHGAVLLDENLNVLRSTIIWTDQRSAAEAAFLKENYGERIFQEGFQMPTPTWTLPQLLWLQHNDAETMAKVRYISFVKDYIRFRLTGNLATDRIECQGTLLADLRTNKWSEFLCGLAGISTDMLPPICEVTDIAGHVTAEAAEATGLPKGMTVAMGASDSAVEDYAAGAINPGQCILKLATAGNVNVMTAKPYPHPATLTYAHVIPGLWYTVSATNAAAICQRWFRDLICTEEKRLALEKGINPYVLINELAEASPIGSNGVFFHPYLSGERSPYWDANLRGSFTGLSMGTTKGDLSRALLEGVAFSLKDCHRTLEEMGLPVSEYILIGGGAKSKLWSRIICDLFQAPCTIPASCDASFGSALIAGTAIGAFADTASAVKSSIVINEVLQPNADVAEQYQALFDKYRKLHDALAVVYRM